jgi:type II secretory pathway pseudopilin PulG
MDCSRPATAGTREEGFTYLGLMIAIVIMGMVQAALAQAWHADAQREKEKELLFAGDQMRAALKSYYAHSPAQSPRHPLRLEDLLQDSRSPSKQRYLRKIYRDPITGKSEWGMIRGAGGEIFGVHSLSELTPLKQGDFSRADRNFAGAQRYSDWVFMLAPGQQH